MHGLFPLPPHSSTPQQDLMFSVVIPLHNRRELVLATIASVLDGTWREVEVVVSDDGSTDGSLDAVHERFGHDGRVRIVEASAGAPRGAPAARNRGAAVAEGAWMVFLDSDDLLAPHALAHRASLLRADPALAFVATQQQWMTDVPHPRAPIVGVPTWLSLLDRLLLPLHPFGLHSLTWTRAAWEATSPWNESLAIGQDWDLHLRLFARDVPYVWSHVPDAWYRRGHPAQGVRVSSPQPDAARARVLAGTLLRAVHRLDASGQWNERRAGLALLGLAKFALLEVREVGLSASSIVPAIFAGPFAPADLRLLDATLRSLSEQRQFASWPAQRRALSLALWRGATNIPLDVRPEGIRPPWHRAFHAAWATGVLRSAG